MSDEDEGGLGGLFGSVDDEVQPEYPVEELMVNRLANASEGCTNAGFEPLLDRFEGMKPLEGEDVEATLTRLRTRITALNPSPLRVFYRNKRHSLWGHKLWNAAKYLSKRMDEGMIDVFNKTVLELGAGLGVPALVAYRNGAKRVIVTDYPDADLLDVIQLNVTENCTPESVDEDQRQRYEDLYKRRVQQEGGDVVEGELSKEQKQAACSTMCVVEPLLWGKEEHIKKVMSYTNGQGFDVVILSDILFNHVCNDDLADTLALTLQKSPSAAAYCVFSHHRAHKELNDYEFFDKCVARGLHYEQIDEQDYELMFPEDRGPVEVRKPVKCYRIVHRFDAAGPGLDVSSVFDVAIQGTSLAQSYLAAALARSGLRVLMCDGEGSYGGPSATFGWEQFIEYIAEMGTNDAATSSRVLINEGHNLTETQRRRFLFDLLPSVHIARGEVIKQLISSGLTSNSGLEFQRAARFVFIEGLRHDVRSASATMVEVPLSRSGIFNTEMLSLMDKRRLMKFVKDVEATLAEELHAADANLGDLPVVERAVGQQDAASSVIQQAAAENPTEMLSSFLRRKYDLSPAAVDAVTVMKQLDKPTQVSSITEEAMPSLVQSAEYVRQMISSVGAYEGKTPFLVPAYGSSELAQGLCRSSAVWGGVAVLRRSMTRIVVDEEKERQYAVLSNGQYVRASIIVVPEEATSRLPVRLHDWRDVLERERQRNALGDGAVKEAFVVADCLGDRAPAGLTPRRTVARVVLALKTPLISWDSVREMSPVEGSDFTESPPIVVAFLRCASTGRMIELVQQSSSCDQASEGMVVVHFTTEELSVEELEAFVKLNFFKSKEDASTGSLGVLQSDVVLFSSFVIDGVQIAERSLNVLGKGGVDLPSETRKSHPYTIEECLKLQNATEQDRRLILHEGVDGPSKEAAPEKEQRAPPMVEVFTVPTISGNTLQQDAYLHAAQRVYEHIADVAVASSSMNVSKDRQKYVFLGCNTPTTD